MQQVGNIYNLSWDTLESMKSVVNIMFSVDFSIPYT